MEKIMYNPISDEEYIEIITILDYEISLCRNLSNIVLKTANRNGCKVIVDLALKTGLNKYSFAAYDIADDGKILWNSGRYIAPCEEIVKLANSFIRQKKDVLPYSMFSNSAQAAILRN